TTPPTAPGASSAEPPAPSRIPVARTNLEEIADWLSKLILGGTLFEPGHLIQHLKDAGFAFAATITDEPTSSVGLWSGVGSTTIVYFGVCGVFGGYFVTRLYLLGALR